MQIFKLGQKIPRAVYASALLAGVVCGIGSLWEARGAGVPNSGVTLPAGPLVLQQPADFAVAPGGAAVFRVLASGSGALGYQWRKNGAILQGETASELSVPEAQEEDAGQYDVLVTDSMGTVASSRASLVLVTGGARVTYQTASESVAQGGRKTLRVLVGDSDGVSYQWRKDGVPIVGATGAALSLSPLKVADSGSYDVLVTNTFGVVQTVPTLVSVQAGVQWDLQRSGYRWFSLSGVGVLTRPAGLAVDEADNVYVSDAFDNVIRRISSDGSATVVAGSLGFSGFADGDSKAALFDSPQGIALDQFGNVFVADTGNNVVRRVDRSGKVITVAGSAGQFDVSGGLQLPRKVAVDGDGGLYVLDATSLRKVRAGNQFSLLLGDAPDAAPTGGILPQGLAVDGAGQLFAAANVGGESQVLARSASGAFTNILPSSGLDAGTGDANWPVDDVTFGQGGLLYGSSLLDGKVFLFGKPSAASGLSPVELGGALTLKALPAALAVGRDGTVYLADDGSGALVCGTPEGIPVIRALSTNVTVKQGTPALLAVDAVGAGELAYQWLKDGMPINGAALPTYAIPAAQLKDSGRYQVVVSNAAGAVTTFPATLLVQGTAPGVTVLQQPANPLSALDPVPVIRGSKSTISVGVDRNGIDAAPVSYQLLAYNNGVVGSVAFGSGVVPDSGVCAVALGGLSTSGDYVVRFSYKVAGVTKTVDSNPFAVVIQGLETAAGNYEALLKDVSGGLLGDGAVYRGVVLVSVSKSGSVSGRVLYNEASPVVGAVRGYTPVTRAFAASFVLSADGNPLKMVCNPKLGSGLQANRQELQLELDFSVSPPELNAVVRDNISYSGTMGSEVCVSEGSHGKRALASLKSALDAWAVPGMKSPEGRYVLSADTGLDAASPGSDNRAYALLQVLASGKVLWVSRTSGVAGSGSDGLVVDGSGKLSATFYEGSLSSTNKLLNTRSLLGEISLSAGAGGVWSASLGVDGEQGYLERQSTWVVKNTAPTPWEVKWSQADLLAFTKSAGSVWTGATKDGLMSYLSGQTSPLPTVAPVLYLRAADPVSATIYTWSVNVSSTGTVRVASYPAGTVQPTLSLRLDRTRGEWTGSFTSTAVKGLRCTLNGAADSSGTVRASGWTEAYAMPALKSAEWTLGTSASGN